MRMHRFFLIAGILIGSNAVARDDPKITANSKGTPAVVESDQVKAAKISAEQSGENARIQAEGQAKAAEIAAKQAESTKWIAVLPGAGAVIAAIIVLIASEMKRKSDQKQFDTKRTDDLAKEEWDRRHDQFNSDLERLARGDVEEATSAMDSLVMLARTRKGDDVPESRFPFYRPTVIRLASVLAFSTGFSQRKIARDRLISLMEFACDHKGQVSSDVDGLDAIFLIQQLRKVNTSARYQWVIAFAHYAVTKWEVDNNVAEVIKDDGKGYRLFASKEFREMTFGDNIFGEEVEYALYDYGSENAWVWNELFALCPFIVVDLTWPYLTKTDPQLISAFQRIFYRAAETHRFRRHVAMHSGVVEQMTPDEKQKEKAACIRNLSEAALNLASTRSALSLAIQAGCERGIKCSRLDFSKVFLAGGMCQGWEMDECNFEDADLTGATFEACNFGASSFDRISGECANFENAVLSFSSFDNANLSNAVLNLLGTPPDLSSAKTDDLDLHVLVADEVEDSDAPDVRN